MTTGIYVDVLPSLEKFDRLLTDPPYCELKLPGQN